MWKKEDVKPQGSTEISTPAANATIAPSPATRSGSNSPATPSSASTNSPNISQNTSQNISQNTSQNNASVPVSGRAAACISQGIKIKGEVTGSEDLFVDGHIEGKLNMANGSVTVGPNGSVKADINAREVIVRGHVEGKITGRDKVQLWNTGVVNGEVQTDRLAIEDGATLRGKVEAGKSKTSESKAAAASATGKSTDAFSVGSGTAAD